MDNNKNAAEVRKAKEMDDIKSEYSRVEKLLNDGKWNELSEYLQHLNAKYFVEIAIFNLSHPTPAQNLQQNAVNCLEFLRELALSKAAKRAIDDENCRG